METVEIITFSSELTSSGRRSGRPVTLPTEIPFPAAMLSMARFIGAKTVRRTIRTGVISVGPFRTQAVTGRLTPPEPRHTEPRVLTAVLGVPRRKNTWPSIKNIMFISMVEKNVMTTEGRKTLKTGLPERTVNTRYGSDMKKEKWPSITRVDGLLTCTCVVIHFIVTMTLTM